MTKTITVFRFLRRNLKLTLINILGMAIGLAASGIILIFVHQEYHFDASLRGSENIYRIIEKDGEREGAYTYAPLAEALKQEFPEVEATIRMAFYYGFMACRAGDNSYNERNAVFADPHFFGFFSFPLTKGDPAYCLPDKYSVALSETAAQKYFGDIDPLGKLFEIGRGQKFTVTAVYDDFPVNSNFSGDIILPLECISELTQVWIEPSWNYESDINTFALLEENVSKTELTEKTRLFLARHTDNKGMELHFQPLSDIHTNKQYMWESSPQVNIRILRILFLVAFLILGVSTVNFLFLYIGIVSQRTTGIGLKKAFGASKRILFREYFKEVTMLMMLSLLAAIGIVMLYLEAFVPSFALPDLVYLDASLLFYLILILVVTDLVAGVYPSIILSSKNTLTLFQPGSKANQPRYKALPFLSIIQFIICISLMSFNFLLQKQTIFLTNRDTGYAREKLITIPMNMPLGQGIHGERFGTFAEELKRLPAIDQVSASFSSPASAETYTDGVAWEGQSDELKLKVVWGWESVSFDYFKTLGVEIVHGRGFDPGFSQDIVNWDTRKCAYIINETGLREMGVDDPLGKTFSVWGFNGPIVGVVKDYHFQSMHSEIQPIFYILDPVFWNEVVVRLASDQEASFDDIQKVWKQFGDDYPLEINYVEDQVRGLYTPEQGLTKVLTLFSLLTVMIIVIGVITLSIFNLNRRKKEIGIRKVNGATSREILVMLNKQYARFALVSFLLALPLSWFFMQKWLTNYAYKTSIDWWIFFSAGLITLLVALITTSWKGWRVARKNPVESLRLE